MKLKNIIPFALVALILSLNSCYDEKMEWNDPYTHPAAKDLPLGLQEKISRYAALNTYTSFKLGVGIDFNLYMNDEAYRKLVNENFDEITPGNEMKQSSIMNSKGELNFTTVDNVLNQLKTAGLTVYGHTLVWHNQQQASYLNSLIAPVIVPAPAGESLIDGSFESGLNGFEAPYYKEAVTVTTDEAIEGSHSMKVAVGDWGKGKYDMQINSPSFPIIKGHHYEISFFIKSNIPGSVGIDFPNGNLGNQYPRSDGHELTPTSSNWTQVIYNNETVGESGMIATVDHNTMTFRFLLGSTMNCTYYIDNVVVLDLDAEQSTPNYVNMVEHGTFDEYENSNALYPDWNSWGGTASPTRELSAEGEGYGGKGKCLIIHSAGGSNDYSVQATTNLTEAFNVTHEYHVEAMIKSSVANGSVRIQFQGGSATYLPADDVGAAWIKVGHDFTPTDANNKLFFDLGLIAGDYYIDNVVVYDKTAIAAKAASHKKVLKAGSITIPKTPEEKAAILEPVLQKYVTDVVSHFAGKVAAWDVVNEPMSDNGTVRAGEENLKSTDVFYWQYYLGKDYAVKAFKYAKEGDPNAKLFINDYNLETASGSKLDGLIDYVKYIESQGAKIDGIGTQMHLNINWTDTNAVKTMFQKLAATGKLIKISELDIAVANSSNPSSPVSPTTDEYTRQAELYRFVVAMYNQYIPQAQRYGITVWGVSDNEKEHEYWLKNDVPCLWNADYARKHAYKGFADGLAGKDVSSEFSGELVY